MKKMITFVLLNFIFSLSHAQELSQFTDISACKEFAQKNEHNVLMIFSGSDWCRPCIQFKKDILMNSEFQETTKDRLAILYLDFPSKKKNKLSKEQTEHNELLAEKYNKSGAFPQLVLFDAEMNKLKELKYRGQSVKEFIAQLDE